MRSLGKLFLAGLLICQNMDLEAREPYKATVKVDFDSATVTAPNLVDLKRDLSAQEIKDLIPIYTPVSETSINFDLRGINALAAFPQNSTTLIVKFPQTGNTQVFTGATRNDSLALFKEFVRDGGRKNNLLKNYARYSPIDPIAGNPNSLMAQMGQADYLAGHLSPLSGCDTCWSAQPIVNQVQVGLNSGRAFDGGFDTTSVTLPLRYSRSPDLKWAFILDAPITYLRNGGASSLVSSLGTGLRIPILDDWSLTPIVRFGAGGSLDLCTAGVFVSAGITSVFNYKVKQYVLSMTNYASYMSSTNLWLTGINWNYHLHNYIIKNGLSVTTCEALTICNRPLNFSVNFVDSYFAREHLYIRHYDEVGISIITNYINPLIDFDSLSLGFSFQFGQHQYRGYFVNMAYQF